MARSKRNEVVAGLFVLVSIGVTLGVVLWLGAADVFKAGGQIASFYVPQSEGPAGLQEGSEVVYGDSSIGKIVKIETRVDLGRCIYRARIDRRDITIRADGNAVVVSPPIGTAKLAITRFGTAAQLADDLHPIPLAGGLNKAMNDIAVAADNIRKISDVIAGEFEKSKSGSMLWRVDQVMQDLKKATGDVAGIAANIRAQTDVMVKDSLLAQVVQMTGQLNRQMDPNERDSLLAKIHRAIDDVGAMTADARPKIEKTMTAVSDVAARMDEYTKKDVADLLAKLRESNSEVLKIAKNFAEVSDQTKKMVSVNRDKIDELIDNMTLVSAELKATSKDVRRNPWKLLYTPSDKQFQAQNIYDAARAFMQGAEELDAAIGKMNELARTRATSIPADDPELQKIRDHLKDTFAKFSKAEQALWKELQK